MLTPTHSHSPVAGSVSCSPGSSLSYRLGWVSRAAGARAPPCWETDRCCRSPLPARRLKHTSKQNNGYEQARVAKRVRIPGPYELFTTCLRTCKTWHKISQSTLKAMNASQGDIVSLRFVTVTRLTDQNHYASFRYMLTVAQMWYCCPNTPQVSCETMKDNNNHDDWYVMNSTWHIVWSI